MVIFAIGRLELQCAAAWSLIVIPVRVQSICCRGTGPAMSRASPPWPVLARQTIARVDCRGRWGNDAEIADPRTERRSIALGKARSGKPVGINPRNRATSPKPFFSIHKLSLSSIVAPVALSATPKTTQAASRQVEVHESQDPALPPAVRRWEARSAV